MIETLTSALVGGSKLKMQGSKRKPQISNLFRTARPIPRPLRHELNVP